MGHPAAAGHQSFVGLLFKNMSQYCVKNQLYSKTINFILHRKLISTNGPIEQGIVVT